MNIVVNGRSYNTPTKPTVVVCIDGCEPEYLEKAISAGATPWLAGIRQTGTWHLALSAMPSFTNPNNLSIVTGVPPSIHGISGNYFLDEKTGREVMMNDSKYLRAPTILKGFEDAGFSVAVITAKDKLRALLGNGLTRSVCFSSERAGEVDLSPWGLDTPEQMTGMALPDVYSAELSLFALAAGVKVLKRLRPDLMYISTTDFIQHKYPPGSNEANTFLSALDSYLEELDRLGAVIGITADHGMKPKAGTNGKPNAAYLQEFLDERLGIGLCRVTLPITDPYVVHHGALGSFACVYLFNPEQPKETVTGQSGDFRLSPLPGGPLADRIRAELSSIPQVMMVLPRKEAAERFELPEDRIGDLVVVAREDAVLGTRAEDHDLSCLEFPLRSHGGLTEQEVPWLANRQLAINTGSPSEPSFSGDSGTHSTNSFGPASGQQGHPASLDGASERRPRNFDIFDLVLNRVSVNR